MMAKNTSLENEEPKVPDGPTAPAPRPAPVEIGEDNDGDEDFEEPSAPGNARPAKAPNKGGRKPWPELAEENRLLQERVQKLLDAATVLARLPYHADREDAYIEYSITRLGRTVRICRGEIRRARRAVGLEE
jgi:hypothetical protein